MAAAMVSPSPAWRGRSVVVARLFPSLPKKTAALPSRRLYFEPTWPEVLSAYKEPAQSGFSSVQHSDQRASHRLQAISVLVNGKAAYLFYAPFDDSVGAGFQAYGEDEDGFELDPDENTVFYGNTPTEEIEISNEYVCSREKAIEVVLAFMDCDEWPSRYEDLPDCVEWEEL